MIKLNVENSSLDYNIEIKHPEIIIIKDFISDIEQQNIVNKLNDLKESQ
jgi:hypothetical protein